MSFSRKFIIVAARALTSLIFRIDDAQLEAVPDKGPLIVFSNHVNFMEVPTIYTHLQPRTVFGMMLADRWKNPLLRWMLNSTGTIPLHRGQPNPDAMRKVIELLKTGCFLIIMPEGTRSGDGILQPAFPGVVLLALRSGAPLLPIGFYGAEHYKQNLSRLKRTDFHFVVGKPFSLNARGEALSAPVRQQMTSEIMYRLAAILPPAYRGVYADLTQATQDYLVFPQD
jgi:1-acyl-sn-glycerol-3-phosphate acyltransferase